MNMSNLPHHERAGDRGGVVRSASSRALVVSLAAVLATLACAASDSSPSAGSPRLALVAETAQKGGTSAISGRVRIESRFRGSTSGTFEISGAISDTGSFKAVRRIVGGRLQLTEVLAGKLGTIRIRATRPCAGRSGTWRALSGSGAYRGVSGGGAASGGPRCAAPTYPVRAIYTGTLRTPPPTPPPSLAQPGRYGGGTSQREEVIFDVEQGGRTLAGLRLDVRAPCAGSTFTTRALAIFPGPQEIAQDKSFVFRSETSASEVRVVTGRFTSPTTAEGTASATTTITVTSTNTTYTCSESVSWTASVPPPAGMPGRYCGVTGQGPSICLDVGPSGREVARVEVGFVVRCQSGSMFELQLTFTEVRIGGHLGFFKNVSSFEGLVTGSGRVSGLLDPDGTGASGTVNLIQPSFDHEGTRYTCRSVAASWTAKRQG